MSVMEFTSAAEVRAANRAAIDRRNRLRNPKPVEIVQRDEPQEVPIKVAEPAVEEPSELERLTIENQQLHAENRALRVDNYNLRQRYERPSEYKTPIMMRQIKAACAEAFGVTVSEIESSTRRWLPTRARTAACWLGQRLSQKSSTEIGMTLGDRDHSTILVAGQRACQLLESDTNFAEHLIAIRERLIEAANA
jgi:chromosomal replication initiation ATPase DnaA